MALEDMERLFDLMDRHGADVMEEMKPLFEELFEDIETMPQTERDIVAAWFGREALYRMEQREKEIGGAR